MLHALNLQNFALIDQHEVNFDAGFNVITGETGAGKSLLLDALSLCTGGRFDSAMVRHGAPYAELYAQFESHCPDVQAWFDAQGREWSDGEIIIRRQLSEQGRSKAWINGAPASLAELKSLGSLLVNIHSQHAGLELLKPQFVIEWLDRVAQLLPLAEHTQQAYHHWQHIKAKRQSLSEQMSNRLDRIDLLTAKLADIEPLLAVDMTAVETEYDELSNIESLIQNAYTATCALNNDGDAPDALGLLARASKLCEHNSHLSPSFAQCADLLSQAHELIYDASVILSEYADTQTANPARLQELDDLMSLAHRLSNKYRLPIGELLQDAHAWQQELDELHALPDVDSLEQDEKNAFDAYLHSAKHLQSARIKAAPVLCAKLEKQLSPLALPNAVCEFSFKPKQPNHYSAAGIDDIELLFSANVGIPKQPLHKIASGGELSRMALVMQVMSADTQSSRPMLVFDEVDVGISGGTAQVVGELLRSLGTHQQLLAITHQAQVAAAAHQHILVSKEHGEQTRSQLCTLSHDERIKELARMSGGVDITDTTLAHAKDLLHASTHKKSATKKTKNP